MVEDNLRPRRHDGTSPLPLGMDASPAPLRWTGSHTVWPHDPPTGWSYCVTIPSWIMLSEPKSPEHHKGKPTVFYRVQVGIQSPDAVSTLNGVLRRFSEFLKLHSTLKHAFPKKKLPLPPPKKSLTRMITNKNSLQQRRLALVDWITTLLADIDVSRSAAMASFLELEVAARLAIPDAMKDAQRWEIKDIVRQELVSLQNSKDTVEQVEEVSFVDTRLMGEEEICSTCPMTPHLENTSSWQGHRHSIDSNESESSFISGSELSFATVDAKDPDLPPCFDTETLKGLQAFVPSDQRGNTRKVLFTLQRKVTTAKADMEDLIVRLNQETALKDFLMTKIRDLESDLQNLKQKSIESLQEAVSVEREGYRNLQWELEESCVALTKAQEESRVVLEALQKAEKKVQELEMENKSIKDELLDMNEKFQQMQINKDNCIAKAMAETKVLAKEIKILRKSQPDLKQKLDHALKRNEDLEKQLHEHQKQKDNRLKIMHEVGALSERLRQCTVDFLAKEDARSNENNTAITDAADLLMTSDSRIGLLLAEAQLLAEEKDDNSWSHSIEPTNIVNEGDSSPDERDNEPLRKMLTDIFISNAHLHKLVNSLTLRSLSTGTKEEKKAELSEPPARKSVLTRFL